MKRVAIDSGPLTSGHKVRGIGFHTKFLIEELNKIKSKDVRIDAVDFGKTDLSKYDLIHYPDFNPYFLTLPSKYPTKAVVTIHDLIYLRFPKAYPPGVKGKANFLLQKQRVNKAKAVITISNASKKDIVKFIGTDPKKIHAIHLAANKVFRKISDKKLLRSIKRKYKLPDRFVLYVGDINYNKNIGTLIKACGITGLPLVIIGKQALEIEEMGTSLRDLHGPRDWIRFVFGIPHPELAHYKQLVGEFRKNTKVIRLGFIPIEDLVVIFNLATVYCQPSFYEGFGLPILEAMACGTPVVASRIVAHQEVAGSACQYFDPNSPTDLAKKLRKVIDDVMLRRKLSGIGQKQAKKYSWKDTTIKTRNVYKQLLES